MAFRTIQVGDDLSGKRIYCDFPENPSWFIGGLNGAVISTTNGAIMNHQTGVSHMEESVWLEDNDDNHIEMYEMWDYHAWVHEPYIICPSNFGIVTAIETNSGIYPLLTISTGELEDTIYYGTNRIEKIYYNGENILKIYPGGKRLGTFTVNNTKSFHFLEGQTWREWVAEKKYWINEDGFAISQQDEVIYNFNSTLAISTPSYHGVRADELIKSKNYTAGKACLDGQTKIKTINNVISIAQLKIGEILSENNKVEKIVQHNRTSYYEIYLNNGDIIKASNDHRFILFNKEIKTTDKININDYLTETLFVEKIVLIKQSLSMYEIKTTNNTYELFNGIICECEDI